MLRSTQRRLPPAIFWPIAVVLLLAMQEAGCVWAQGALPATPPASAAIQLPDSVAPRVGTAQETATTTIGAVETGRFIERDAVLGLAEWDHTLLGAFQLGAKLLRRSATSDPLEANALLSPRKSLAVFSTSGSHSSMSSFLSVSPLDQLSRSGMNVAMKSAFGNFNLKYREIFTGRPNSLGGGVGQASAAAMFTTPGFGSGRKFDFSAAALMGTGSVNTLMGGGFGNSAIGGNGPGRKSQNSPTVAVKFTF